MIATVLRLAALSLAILAGQPPMDRLQQCVDAARAAGCPRDQVARYLAANLAPTPRQWAAAAAARLCDLPSGPTRVGYGGARGGGKSHWGLAQVFVDDCGRVPGLKFLYLRKVGKAGREQVQDLRRSVLHSTPHEYKASEGVLVRRDNGSRVVLGHFQTDKDIDAYLGLEYDGVLIEEATQLTARKVKDIATCVRTSKPTWAWRPRIYFTTNPGNVGHAWFKALFIAPLRAGSERDTRFVQATVRDNPHVNPEYRASLESLTGWQRKAWLDGDWDCLAGQFFTGFDRDVHVIRPFDAVPLAWRLALSLDYGYTHQTVVTLLARTPDGVRYALDCHRGRRLLTPQHDAGIRSMLARNRVEPRRVSRFVAGSDVFAKRHDGRSVAESYAALGWDLEAADMDRLNGAAEILAGLGSKGGDGGPTVAPTLFVSERCPELADSLPALEHDPNRPEDVRKVDCDDDGNGGDDDYDSFRYGVMALAESPSISVGVNPFAGYRG